MLPPAGVFRALVICLAALLGAVGTPARATAAPGVTVTMISSPDLTLDSNKPTLEGPQAAYVAFRITNNSGAALSNVRATLGGLTASITLGGVSSGNPQAASQYIGTMAAGTSRVLYWFIEYPTTFGVAANLTVAVTDNTAGSTVGPVAPSSGTVTTRSMVSAQAGGVLINAILGAGAVVGQTITTDIQYEYGGVSVGDTYNLQPTGGRGFPAGCFQLTKMMVVSSSITSTPDASANTVDKPYFAATSSQGGSKIPIVIRYSFKYLCAGVTAPTKPYGNGFSGGQLKYSSNYESFVGPTLPGATNPFSFTKTAAPRTLPAIGGTVTFTLTLTNPSQFVSEVDSIVDVLPAGLKYGAISAGSGVTTANSGSVPAANATGTLVWRATPGTSYVLPAGGSLTLIYTAIATADGQWINNASALTGATVLGAPGADTVWVGTADLSVVKTGPAKVVAGDTVIYVITTSNAGPSAARYLTVTDSLPAGVTFLSATNGGTASGGVVTWPVIATLAANASRIDSVRVRAPATLGGITNVVAGTSRTYDATAANNNGSAAPARVQTAVTTSVQVTALPDTLQRRLPGTRYPQLYRIRNLGGTAGSFDVLARLTGTPSVFLTTDSISPLSAAGVRSGVRPDSLRLTINARDSIDYRVWYTVPMGDTAVNAQYLRARASTDTLLRGEDTVSLRRVIPKLVLTKQVSPTGSVAIGTVLTYTMVATNVGEFAATAVALTDSVPVETQFKVGSVSQTLPAGITATVSYSNNAGLTWTYVPVSAGCGAPAGFDACVRRIRWTLGAPLPAGSTASRSTFVFLARLR